MIYAFICINQKIHFQWFSVIKRIIHNFRKSLGNFHWITNWWLNLIRYANCNFWSFNKGDINEYHIYLQGHFLFQLNSVAIVASIFTTVVLAFERYLAVSKPIEYHNATLGINPWRRVMNYIIPVVLFSIIFNIPKFFEIKIQEYPDNPDGTNCW